MDTERSEHSVILQVIIVSPKHDIKSLYFNLRIIHEYVILKTNKIKINNEIFQWEFTWSSSVSLARIPLPIELKNTHNGYKSNTKKNKPIIWERFKNDNDLGLLGSVKWFWEEIGIQSQMCKSHT